MFPFLAPMSAARMMSAAEYAIYGAGRRYGSSRLSINNFVGGIIPDRADVAETPIPSTQELSLGTLQVTKIQQAVCHYPLSTGGFATINGAALLSEICPLQGRPLTVQECGCPQGKQCSTDCRLQEMTNKGKSGTMMWTDKREPHNARMSCAGLT